MPTLHTCPLTVKQWCACCPFLHHVCRRVMVFNHQISIHWLCYCTLHYSMLIVCVEANLRDCFNSCVIYINCHWRSSYQEGSVGISLNGLTPPHLCACPKPGHGFPTSYVMILRYFVCSVSSAKMRGDCSFCWY
jgi:hypothetical protein